MKIKKDLFLVSGGIYGKLGNVCCVKHDHGAILIDCGSPDSYGTIIENLHYWGINEKDITHVLLTHGHDDHAGCACDFQKLGARIIIGSGDEEMLKRGDLGNGSPFNNHVMPPCNADTVISNDTVMKIDNLTIRIIRTPGHSRGSLVYDITSDEGEYLFSGDTFCCEGEKGDIAVTWWKGDISYNADALGRSLKKLFEADLHPDVVVGGHNNPRIGSDAVEMIRLAYKYYLLNDR